MLALSYATALARAVRSRLGRLNACLRERHSRPPLRSSAAHSDVSSYPDRLHATLCACDCAVGQSEFCASATLLTGSEHAHRKCDVRVRPYSLRVRRTRTCAERVPPYSRVRSTRTLCALCRAPSFCVAQSLGVSPLSDALGGVRHAHWASDYPLLASQRATKSLRCSCTRNLLYSYNSKASRLLGYATDPQHQTV